ncbi:MAG: mechanosensitive ion channel family protein [Fimbriimonas sp.]
MSTPGLISLVLAFAIPILVGLAFSRVFLPKIASKIAQAQNRPISATIFEIVRLPVVILSWLAAVYVASHVLRGEDLAALRWVNWDALELWIRVAATLVTFFLLYRAFRYGLGLATAKLDAGSSVLLQKILSAVFLAVAIVTALNQFSIDIGPVLASLGVAALAVALALQDTLSNYFAGITLAADKPIRPGDYVKLEGGLEGFVQSIGWRTTHIKPFAETVVVVPNSKLANSILTNTNYPDEGVRVYVNAGVSYESDLEEVERTALEVARHVQATVEGADHGFEPICLFNDFGESNIGFQIILRATHYAPSGRIKHTFIKSLHAAFRDRQIEMNYPVRKLVGDPRLFGRP